jgi:hypothetical protein
MICDKKNGCHPKKHKKKSCKCRDYSSYESDSSQESKSDSSQESKSDSESDYE